MIQEYCYFTDNSPENSAGGYLDGNWSRLWRRSVIALILLSCAFCFLGCIGKSEQEVVVYCALDKEFSEPILDEFRAADGVSVLPKYDQESNKTVGLVTTIIEQKDRPRCDLFWNNEILHTLRLRKLGLLEIYDSPFAKDYPSQFVGSDKTWYGFAARARVLIVNTALLPNQREWPTSIYDLADEKWKDNCGIARPLFGTTASHAAVLFAQWGAQDATTFFGNVANNAVVEGGNKQVALNVAAGKYAFGLTDTDDAIIEQDAGKPVVIVYPDQFDNGSGCLLIPNTLAVIKGGPNTENAKKLVDHLLAGDVEKKLAAGSSAQIPLNKIIDDRSRAVGSTEIRWMTVDFEDAAEQWDQSRVVLERLFPIGK